MMQGAGRHRRAGQEGDEVLEVRDLAVGGH
jgi:hypothetical protein